ncbi:alpha-L-rhamnosidase [Actinomadura opuntiae]|uniref:alpha-L-rhamnosidase n=1 Tax=Actinomadura sp. OS1-43 TaxID=604315 RepID=UPI00255AEA44|nr:alpha-L-rhamnosidase [Actinomadura sp. OS1-43]MDL4821824.1 family 78 glycoside hydrolase catalytic domain [Actinomadura sp. OS1-43]
MLTTERVVDPLGVDEGRPLFGWRLEGDGRGRAQSAYRLVVAVETDPASTGAQMLWDSGWREGDENVDVAYGGPSLSARTRYLWRVRVADEHGRRSAWSDPAAFETGLAPGGPDAQAAFPAAWITAPGELESAALPGLDTADGQHDIYRIRAACPDPATGRKNCATVFRVRFAARSGAVPAAARLLATGSGTVTAVLNGVPVPVDGLPSPALAVAMEKPVDGHHALAVLVQDDDEQTGHGPVDRDSGPYLLAALTDGTRKARPGPAVPHAVATDDSWRARPLCADGEEDWTDPSLDDRDDGRWPRAIADRRNGDAPDGRVPSSLRPSPYLRRAFELPAPVTRARLYATSLGLHELRLNGVRVGDEDLAPGWTDYDHRVTYRTHDVTGVLAPGANTLAAVLADGWYAGNICIFGDRHYGAVRALAAMLVADHPDGSTTTVVTAADGRWRASRGGVCYADLQNGEVYDAREEPTGWDTSRYDDSGWTAAVAADAPPGARIVSALAPPVRAQRRITAASVTALPGGRLLTDFGENLAGRVRIDVRGTAGARVLLRHAEALRHDGELYTENLRTARATDEYVLRGAPDGESWEPRFTTHGFRYCEIIPLPPSDGSGPAPTVDSATAVALWADMPATGDFACSHAGLNTLHRNIGRSLRGNFLSVPTDCPQRDERMGWTGDIQVFAPTAAFHHDIRGFLRSWLRELRGAQHPDGAVPHTVPDMFRRTVPYGERESAAGAAGWGDAAVTVPAALLTAYGDRRAAGEALDSIAAWLDHLAGHSEQGVRPAGGFGDWLALTDTPTDLVATAYYAHAARTAARLAAACGHTHRHDAWTAAYQRVRAAFRERWVGGGGVLRPATQTAYVLALHIGLLDPHEIADAADRLADEIASRGHHLTTGFLGTPWLLDALADAGRLDVAHRLLLQDTYPSWLYPVTTGATTVWERWNSWSDSTGFADASMTSFNHYAYGAVGDWVHRTIGGLAPAEPGYRRVVVAPRPPESIGWAETSLRTVHGTVAVGWRRAPSELTVDLQLPPGVTAEIRLPALSGGGGELTESGRAVGDAEHVRQLPPRPDCAAVLETGSGSYRFTLARRAGLPS